MFQELKIQNFQAHEDSLVQFADGLTVLVGENNTGKTAIFRSLKWLCRNRPRGDSLIRHGQKQVSVTLYLIGGEEIVRTKSKKGRNEYRLDGQTFKALGADVPQQIIDQLGLADINWQDQLDGPFLILDPPGQIASAINDVTHLDEPAAAVDKLSSQIRELDREAKNRKERQESLQVDLRPFAKLGQYEARLLRLMAVHASQERSMAILAGLGDLIEAIEAIDRDIKRTELPDRLGLAIVEYETVQVGYVSSQDGYERLDEIVEGIEETDEQLSRLPDIEAMGKLLGETEQAEKIVKRLGTESVALRGLLDNIYRAEDLADENGELVKERSGDYQELLGGLAVCPACDRPVDDEQRALVVEYLT